METSKYFSLKRQGSTSFVYFSGDLVCQVTLNGAFFEQTELVPFNLFGELFEIIKTANENLRL